jgi:type IV pilus assembly protein PilA
MHRRLQKYKGFTLIELMIVVAIIGILSAIAIPNFVRFQARSRQSEAKGNMKTIFTSQRALFSERDAYSTDITSIGFSPERGNRYTYRLVAAPTNFIGRTATGTDTIAANTAYQGIEADVWRHTVNSVVAQGAPNLGTTSPNGGTLALYTVGTTPHFVAAAAGNIDGELAVLDSWWIGSESIAAQATACTSSVAQNVAGGEPFNSHNDVGCD